jgi:serine/threonine protein kinase
MNSNLTGQTLLNQFRVDAYVASGGMGVVYRVWDLKRSVPLAMKVLHADLADDPSVYKRFKREANALKKLAHPNIVPFYGIEQSRGIAFLLERYVDGPTLKDLLKKRQGTPIPVNEALTYLKVLSAALGYAHTNGVVHCDVKPDNVMIDQGGHIYLTDFGIARHAESTTTTLGAAGTPAYMAPEQIRGEAVTPATDVYALGVILFEMLTGQRPFRGDEKESESSGATAAERIRYGHVALPPPDPRLFNPDLPEALAGVILKSLAKMPSQRYGNTQELFSACCQTLGIESLDIPDRIVAEVENDFVEPAPHFSRWKKSVIAILGAMTTVIVILLAVWWSLIDDNVVMVTETALTSSNQPVSLYSSVTASPKSVTAVSPELIPSVIGLMSETTRLPTQTYILSIKTYSIPTSSPRSVNPIFTSKENMMCRRGPDTRYEHAYDVLKGESYPVMARWENNWLLLKIDNPRVTTSTRCCWVGGEGDLSVSLNNIQLIDNWVEDMRQTCDIK